MDQPAHITSNELEDISFFNLQQNATPNQNALFSGGLAELSEALAAAQNTTPADIDYAWLQDNASQNLSNNSTAVSSPLTPGTPINRPKLGSRFSREVIKTLKHWLASHHQHPYPTEDEMGQLQQRTGLNKAQLTNWFANARRRGKIQGGRSASPQVHNASSSPVDIIQRPGTPAFRRESPYKNPMQRWVDSPPEHEPANVSDIARAMASSSRRSSGDHGQKFGQLTYNDPWRSPYARSITSSAGTSLSSEASNRHSSDSQSSIKNRRVPRRKRASRRQRLGKLPAADPSMPYQCTFCTEIFRTKYDWQRHEKSLHLPLEQWICAMHGPRAQRKDEPDLCCVFCGEKAPDDAHIESHHYTACQERDLEERTFHRKDHLVQHLRLVHQAKFEQWSMTKWMLPMPNIESRCGFCSATMSTWGDRADHLADHFKAGMTMANWKGDWGFTEDIVKLVECAVPPYFIDYERSTLIPMKGSDPPWGSPPNAYELLKIEVEFFVQNYFDRTGQLPSNDKMQLEACRIIFAADATANVPMFSTETIHQSWLRELIMSSPDLTQQAQFGPIRTSRESRHSTLNINGKDHLFEQCTLESQLQAFVLKQQLSGCTVETSQIQHEACEIIRRLEAESSMPSDTIANWLVKGIYTSVEWLMPFKRRVGIPETHDTTANAGTRGFGDISHGVTQFSLDQIFPNTMQSMSDIGRENTAMPSTASVMPPANIPVSSFEMQNLWSRPFLPDDTNFFRIFETDMRRWVAATMSPKNPNCHVPSDEEIQHQARWLMYGGDDSWNQTPADYAEWLWRFKRGVGITKPEDSIDPAQLARLS